MFESEGLERPTAICVKSKGLEHNTLLNKLDNNTTYV